MNDYPRALYSPIVTLLQFIEKKLYRARALTHSTYFTSISIFIFVINFYFIILLFYFFSSPFALIAVRTGSCSVLYL